MTRLEIYQKVGKYNFYYKDRIMSELSSSESINSILLDKWFIKYRYQNWDQTPVVQFILCLIKEFPHEPIVSLIRDSYNRNKKLDNVRLLKEEFILFFNVLKQIPLL